MRIFVALFAALAALFFVPVAAQERSDAPLPPEIVSALEQLKPVSGKVSIPEANATLDLGDQYIFYGREDAGTVLVDLWGNPPEVAEGVLGLVMPKGSSPLSDAWGAVISFEETGYVADDDAATTDYDELMDALKEATNDGNDARTEEGYPTINLVGWAERPEYDRNTHSVVWAQNLRFSDSDNNTLNYDVRTLGRYGVLSLNLVSRMDKLGEVRVAANQFAAHATFDPGSRYTDFNPDTDAQAEYGIAGLIAAGAGVAAVKKLGLFGTIGVFLVKFIKPILIGLAVFGGGLFQAFKNRLGFGGSKNEELYDEYAAEEPFDETGFEADASEAELAAAGGEDERRDAG